MPDCSLLLAYCEFSCDVAQCLKQILSTKAKGNATKGQVS